MTTGELTHSEHPARQFGIRVLIWQSRQLIRLPYLLKPVTETLLAGFRAAHGVHIMSGHGTRHRAEFDAFYGNASMLGRGDVFIWIGLTMDHVPWRALRERGVRCILYQTEPTHRCMARSSGAFAVDELWDFSHHNIEACRRRGVDAPALRYVPLAAVRGPVASRPRDCTVGRPLIFFGNKYDGPLRKRCWDALRAALPKRVYSTYRIWDDASFVAEVLNQFDLFVNLDKDCGDAHGPVTFRNARLLNAGKLIISERMHPADEAEYAGMLLLANNMSHIASLYLQLIQSGDWCERADAAALAFRKKFGPRDVFARARIYRDFLLTPRHSATRRHARTALMRRALADAVHSRDDIQHGSNVERHGAPLPCDGFNHGTLAALCHSVQGSLPAAPSG